MKCLGRERSVYGDALIKGDGVLMACKCYMPAAFINSLVANFSDPGVHFHAGLSDCKAIVGEAAELECKLSNEECEGIWYKDGEEVSRLSKSVKCKSIHSI